MTREGNSRATRKSKSKGRQHKFKNIDAKAFDSVIEESKIITINFKIDP